MTTLKVLKPKQYNTEKIYYKSFSPTAVGARSVRSSGIYASSQAVPFADRTWIGDGLASAGAITVERETSAIDTMVAALRLLRCNYQKDQ